MLHLFIEYRFVSDCADIAVSYSTWLIVAYDDFVLHLIFLSMVLIRAISPQLDYCLRHTGLSLAVKLDVLAITGNTKLTGENLPRLLCVSSDYQPILRG